MWKDESISISAIFITLQDIHVTMKVSTLSIIWILSIVYTSTDILLRKQLWEDLITLSDALTSLNYSS